jgi:uncharacterized protein YceK
MKNKTLLVLITVVSIVLSGCAGVKPKANTGNAGASDLEIQMIETMRDMNAPTNYGV